MSLIRSSSTILVRSKGAHRHKFVGDQQDRKTPEALVAFECRRDYPMEGSAVRIRDPERAELLATAAE